MYPNFASDRDHDEFMGHGEEPDREPDIRIHVDGPAFRWPQRCRVWAEAIDVLKRFGDEWQFFVHVGLHDIDVYVLKREPVEVMHPNVWLREGRA